MASHWEKPVAIGSLLFAVVAGIAAVFSAMSAKESNQIAKRMADHAVNSVYHVSLDGPNLVFQSTNQNLTSVTPVTVTPIFRDSNNILDSGKAAPVPPSAGISDVESRTITYFNVLGSDGTVCFRLENREKCETETIIHLDVEFVYNGLPDTARLTVPSI